VYTVHCTADEIQGTCISRDLGASPHTVKSNRYGGVSPYTTTWPYFAMGHQLNCQVLSLTDENGSDLDSVGSHFIFGITFQKKPSSLYLSLFTVRQLFGAQFQTNPKSNLRTETEHNSINSHAQDTTAVYPTAFVTGIHWLMVKNMHDFPLAPTLPRSQLLS